MMTDPIADMLTVAEREHRVPRRGADAVVEAERGLARILEREGYIGGLDSPRTRGVPANQLRSN